MSAAAVQPSTRRLPEARGSVDAVDPEEAEWLTPSAAARRRYGAVTARSAGLFCCPSCGLLSVPPRDVKDDADREMVTDCPRCAAPLHMRKPASIARTWAFIISALILYIPANVLPITDTRTLFDDQKDTIFSGVVYFWQQGSCRSPCSSSSRASRCRSPN